MAGASIWQPPGLYLFVIGGASAFCGGLVIRRATYGAAGSHDLARRIVELGTEIAPSSGRYRIVAAGSSRYFRGGSA